ncbi:MAG: hypothetical protein AAF497_11165 [Planctomycetota bacterium]
MNLDSLGSWQQRVLNNMNDLPSHFRHIDWATYGLVCLKTLANDEPPDPSSLTELFLRSSSYRILRGSDQSCEQVLAESLQESCLTVTDKWLLHKHLSAGIRIAFLSDLEVIQIRCNSVCGCANDIRACFELSDGSRFTLERLIAAPSGRIEFISQPGDPNGWYNPSAWQASLPRADTSDVVTSAVHTRENPSRFILPPSQHAQSPLSDS